MYDAVRRCDVDVNASGRGPGRGDAVEMIRPQCLPKTRQLNREDIQPEHRVIIIHDLVMCGHGNK
jgi:hypothetical protein